MPVVILLIYWYKQKNPLIPLYSDLNHTRDVTSPPPVRNTQWFHHLSPFRTRHPRNKQTRPLARLFHVQLSTPMAIQPGALRTTVTALPQQPYSSVRPIVAFVKNTWSDPPPPWMTH